MYDLKKEVFYNISCFFFGISFYKEPGYAVLVLRLGPVHAFEFMFTFNTCPFQLNFTSDLFQVPEEPRSDTTEQY